MPRKGVPVPVSPLLSCIPWLTVPLSRLVRRIDQRMLLPTAIIYLLCYLDRSNVGTQRLLGISITD